MISAHGIGKVVASANSEFEKDDIVVGPLGWEDYSIVTDRFFLRKINSTEFPLSYHVGILGIPLLILLLHDCMISCDIGKKMLLSA